MRGLFSCFGKRGEQHEEQHRETPLQREFRQAMERLGSAKLLLKVGEVQGLDRQHEDLIQQREQIAEQAEMLGWDEVDVNALHMLFQQAVHVAQQMLSISQELGISKWILRGKTSLQNDQQDLNQLEQILHQHPLEGEVRQAMEGLGKEQFQIKVGQLKRLDGQLGEIVKQREELEGRADWEAREGNTYLMLLEEGLQISQQTLSIAQELGMPTLIQEEQDRLQNDQQLLRESRQKVEYLQLLLQQLEQVELYDYVIDGLDYTFDESLSF